MFKRLSIRVEHATEEALDQLRHINASNGEFALQLEGNQSAKISKRSAMPLLSGFLPVYVGRLVNTTDGTRLRGYFRFHLGAVGLFIAFIGASLLNLIRIITDFESPLSPTTLWSDPRITFELQYCGFCVLVALFAWLGGKPIRQKIEWVLRSTLET